MARAAAEEWSRYANVRFVFVDEGDAELRIAFKPQDGSWAHLVHRSPRDREGCADDEPGLPRAWRNDA